MTPPPLSPSPVGAVSLSATTVTGTPASPRSFRPGRFRRGLPLLAALLLGVISGTAAAAEQWLQFRGDSQQGLSDAAEVPRAWSDSQNVDWKQALPGSGWSSPIVHGDVIFLTAAVEEGADLSLRAMALSANDGTTVWEADVFSVKEGKIHNRNSHASPTPVYEAGRLYVHFGHDGSACLDAASGEVLWRQQSLGYRPVHGNGGSPVIVGDLLIYSADGAKDPFIVALDKSSGAIAWKTARDVEVSRPFSFSTPIVLLVGAGRQVISPASGAVIAYEPETGQEIWRVDYDEGYSVVPRPVYDPDSGLLFVCTGFGQARLLAIRLDAEARGDVTDSHVVWEYKKGVPKESSPIVVDGLVLFNSDQGVAACLDAATGDLLWQERIAPGSYSTSPVAAAGHVYFQSDQGVATVVRASRDFEKVSENDLGERALSSWAVVDGAIFIRTASHLWRIAE